MRRSLAIPVLAAVCAFGLTAATGSADRSAGSIARAWAIKVIIPGQPSAGTRELDAPADAVAFDGAFSYPADGSIVTASSVTTSVTATSGTQASAGATSQVTSLTLFKGDIVAASVTGETHTSAGASSASGDTGVTGFTNLVVLGQPITPTANQQIQLADWGYVIALEQKSQRLDKPTPGHHDVVTALDVFLTADHGGLPAQSEIHIGYAEANAQASEAAPLPQAPSLPTTTGARPKEPRSNGLPPILSRPQAVTPKQNPQGYVFPVYGDSSFSDTYGAPRGDVPGGWHHGDDIFAPLGAPVLAVARGTVFSVGWNDLGGNRLWLRDEQGNQFYYAHLSAYTPLAVNNAHVSAGAVLGFVGNTGDAQGTPYHLHFEIHPLGLLGEGYDGAVDPTAYLDAWKHLQDLRFATAAGWAPAQASSNAAPQAGAILLQSSDISTANGLSPGSLARALKVAPTEGAAGILGTGVRPPPRGKVVEFAAPRPRAD